MDVWDLNLRHLRAFGAVARLGSIGAATQVIHFSQPGTSQAIARLERQLDIQLFERSVRGMAPTEAARLFAPRVETALRRIDAATVTMAQIRAFLALASAGSYPAASQASGLAQPTLHRAIKDLGLALRRSLVERRGAGVALTAHGRSMARNASLFRADLAAGLSELDRLKGRETGCIAIGALPLARVRIIPAAVTAFRRAHPRTRLRILEGSHDDLLEPLRHGELDLLVGQLHALPPGDDLVQEPLFSARAIIVGRRGHPLSGQLPDLAALAAYPWIVGPAGTPLRIEWERMFAPLGAPLPEIPIESDSVVATRQLVLDSDCLSLMSPEELAAELAIGLFANLGDAPGEHKRVVALTTRVGWRPTAAQRAFLEALAAVVRGGAAHSPTLAWATS